MYLRHPRRATSMLISGAVIAASLSTAYVAAAAVQPRATPAYPSANYGVIKTIGVGNQPYSIAVNDADDTVYVTQYNAAGTLSVINGANPDDTFTVPGLGNEPSGVAVNQTDDTVYVTNFSSDTMTVLNGRSTDDSRTLYVGDGPRGVAVNASPDDTVYVALYNNGFTGDLRWLRAAALDDSATRSLGTGSRGVAIDQSDDTVYISNYNGGGASVVKGKTPADPTLTFGTGTQPDGVAVNSDDDTVYVANFGSDSLTVVNGRNLGAPLTIQMGTGSGPGSIAVDQTDDTVFVTNTGSGSSDTVSILNGRALDDSVTLGLGTNLYGVAVDNAGTNRGLAYVAKLGSAEVAVIGRVTPTSSPISGTAGATVTVTFNVPNLPAGYVMDSGALNTLNFNNSPVAATYVSPNQWQFTVPSGTAGSTVDIDVKLNGGLWASAGTFTYNNPTPPAPPQPAVLPPGPPLNPKAVPGYESSTVTFDPPASSGTYPITRYRVISQPGGQVCYVTPGGGQGGDGGGGQGGIGGIGPVNPGSAVPRAIDPPSTYAEIKTIPVGTYPDSVAVNNASDKVYVVNRESNNVSVIDGRTGGRTDDTLTAGTFPTSIGVNQKDDTVYVGNSRSYSLSVFNGKASGPRSADVTVPLSPVGPGNGPSAVVVDQRDGTVYVPDYGNTARPGAVSVLSGSTNAVTRTFPVGVAPMDAALHEASDTLYLANWVPKDVWAVNARTGSRIGEPIRMDSNASAVAVHQADGTVYATSWGTDAVAVIDGTTKAVTHTIPVQRAPMSVAVDQIDNRVFVVNSQANSLSVIDGVTKAVTHTLRVGKQSSFPLGVAVDGAGTNQGLIYTANLLNNTSSVIAKVTPSAFPARGSAGATVTLRLSVPNLAAGYSMDNEVLKYVMVNGIAVRGVTRGAGNTWTFPMPPGAGTVPITVELRGGLKASAGAFTYQAAPAPLSCTVPNLTPGVEYTFTVEAESQAGWGERSVPSNPAVPYGPIKSTFTTPGLYECTVVGGVGGDGDGPGASAPVTIPFTVKGGKGGTGNQGICDGDCRPPVPNPGGFGASVSGSFDAAVGTKLHLTVGSNGLDAGSIDGGANSAGGGGGGYSAISLSADKDPIVVAGGGGGGSNFNAARREVGSVTANGPVTRATTPRATTPRAELVWTPQTVPADSWGATAYGDGTFVSARYKEAQPTIMTSPDGATWTARDAGEARPWAAVAYGNGTFVATTPYFLGKPAAAMWSADKGVTWASASIPDYYWTSVAYGNGTFVTVSGGGTPDGNKVATSQDGKTWALRSVPAGVEYHNWSSVTFGNGLFVAVAGEGQTAGKRVMTSPDGITWTARTTPADAYWTSVTYGAGLFVAVAAAGDGKRVMTSPDGITWTLRDAPAEATWMSVAYGGGQFLAVAIGDTAMTSSDGITWATAPNFPSNLWNTVVYGAGKFVVVARSLGAPQVITSSPKNPLPSAPTITSTTPGDSQGEISLRPPANATEAGVTNYEYQLDGGAWVALSPASTSSTFVIRGLTNGQTYSVRIRAVGANGVGEASAPATVTPDAPVEAFGNKGGKADPTATKSGGGNGGNTAGEGEFGGTLTTPGSGGRPLSTRPNSGGRGGDGGAPGSAGATATDASQGFGGGGGGGFGASGGAGSAPDYTGTRWSPLPGPYGGGGGGGYDGGGGGGGYAGGGGGAGGGGIYGAGGGGGGSSLLVTASTAAGITNKVDGALAANSTGGSIEIANVKCGYSVVYEGNANTAGTAPTDPDVYTGGSTAVVADGTGLKKDQQVFVGWATSQFGSVVYAPGARLGPINAPVTLWAVYGAPKTVTFDSNQGTGTMAPQSSGSPEALERNTFTRTDYAFTGWNTKADGTGTAYANGATYGFGADLTLYAQWRSAPTPKEEPITEPLGPGEAELKIDGKPEPVVVEPNPITDGLVVVEDDWTMTLEGLGSGGVPLPLNSDGVLVLQAERDARTTGTGFMPNSLVGLFLDPPVEGTTPAARALKTVDLGTVPVDEVGDFSGIKTLPEEIKPGLHVLQAVGYGPAGQRRALSIGILVVPWLELDQGTRKPAGRHDRMSTTGTSGGIDAGSKLTPWIKYNGQGAFKGGKANIRIKADGTFTWTRLIKKSKGLTGYVSWQDVKSNEVYWPKVR